MASFSGATAINMTKSYSFSKCTKIWCHEIAPILNHKNKLLLKFPVILGTENSVKFYQTNVLLKENLTLAHLDGKGLKK